MEHNKGSFARHQPLGNHREIKYFREKHPPSRVLFTRRRQEELYGTYGQVC